MKIPKKVKVGGRIYSIKFVERINDKDDLGESVHSSLTIKIKKGKQASMEEIFWHEVLHCINGSWSEEFICGLSGDIHGLLKDNPKLLYEKN